MASLTIDACAASRAPGRIIRRINKLVTALVSARFDSDLSFEQWIALKATADGIVNTAGELARELDITTGATTRLIDTLEARGLIARDRSGTDRRIVRLCVTPSGTDRIMALAPHVVDTWNEIIADFDQAHVERITADLGRLLVAVERAVARHDAEDLAA